MKPLIALILSSFSVLCFSQSKIDSLSLAKLQSIESVMEIYEIPHSRYTLEYFVFVRKSPGIDPYLQRNEGDRINKVTTEFLNWFAPGDTLMIKEVNAVNIESPGKGLVKLPEKQYVVR